MQVVVGRDDGENFGPFDSRQQAFDWLVKTMTSEEVLTAYRDEAIALERTPVSLRTEEWYFQAKDLAESTDWIVFGIEIFTMGGLDDILEYQSLHDPE